MTVEHIHSIRHGQSEHNARAVDAPEADLLRRDPALRVALLTKFGQKQA